MLTTDTASLQSENAALKLEIARLTEMAYTDMLTGIANRRRFNERLSEEWNRGDRAQSSLALLLIDIDFFKKFNDTHGHPAGDELLQDLGSLWSEIRMRSFDLLARYGGEEFAVILPDTSISGAVRMAERIQEQARRKGITVSIGAAAVVPEQGIAMATLIGQADAALYRSKAEGRDRITAA